LKIKIVDGSSLAAATVLNNIPKGTNQVLLRGKFNKVAFAIANALCRENVQVSAPIMYVCVYRCIIKLTYALRQQNQKLYTHQNN